MTISIVVADDQPLVRAGVIMLLEAQPDIVVVGEASDGASVLELAERLRPDLVLMDIQMPGMDGIEATRVLTRDELVRHDGTDHLVKVLVLTTFSTREAVYGALRAGANGFIAKHAAPQELISAVRKVAGGEAWLDPSIAGRVIEAMATVPSASSTSSENVALGDARLTSLTDREREVYKLVAQGLSNQEIRLQLSISEATVKTHVARVIMKTGSRDRAQAVALAYQTGLMQDPPRRG